MTFPASDPIAPGAARHTVEQISTPKDDVDWRLGAGGERSVRDPGSTDAPRTPGSADSPRIEKPPNGATSTG